MVLQGFFLRMVLLNSVIMLTLLEFVYSFTAWGVFHKLTFYAQKTVLVNQSSVVVKYFLKLIAI